MPLLWVLAMLPLAPLAGFGRAIGLPSLFYDAQRPDRLLVGFALGVHATELWFIAFLLRRQSELARTTIVGFAVTTLAIWVAIASAAMAWAVTHLPVRIGSAIELWLAMVGVATIATAILIWTSTWEQRLVDVLVRLVHPAALRRIAASLAARLDAYDRLQLTVSVPIAVLWLVLSLVEARWPGLPGAFAAVVLSVLTIAIYGFVRYWARDLRMLVYLVLLAALGVCNVGRYQAAAPVPDLVAEGAALPSPPTTTLPKNPALLRDVDVLGQWRAHADRPRLVVIATSGGGIRAAAWTAHVLRGLEQDDALVGIGRHVRVITGASGGMVGAATWVATLVAPEQARACGSDARCLHGGHEVFDEVATDSLDALAVHFALWLPDDRGVALEHAWVRASDALARPLVDLAAGEREGWLPSLIFSPIIVENGRRVLVSNLDLHALTSTDDPWPYAETAIGPGESLPAFELFALYPDAKHFSVATAARLSASFPYVSPFPRLPVAGDPVHVADAGIYDNFGVDLASRWIAANAGWLMANVESVALVQIRDEVSTRTTLAVQEPELSTRATYPLSGPLAAFLHARESTSAFRNDHAIDVLRARFAAEKGDFFFRSFTFELSGEVSLSWRLSEAEQDTIRASLPDGGVTCPRAEPTEVDAVSVEATQDCAANIRELDRLRDWWSEP
jgi:hypothetical protein